MLKKYAKPYPTIGEIIAAKDYDYVSYRGYDEKAKPTRQQPAIILMVNSSAALR